MRTGVVAGKVESTAVTRKDQYNYKQSNVKWTPISTVLFRIELLELYIPPRG